MLLDSKFIDILVNCAAEALAKQVSEENYRNGLIYPPFSNIRKISANIAANVAAKAYELGVCSFSLIFHPHLFPCKPNNCFCRLGHSSSTTSGSCEVC